MPFGNAALPSTVYRFGCKLTGNVDEIRRQMRAKHVYGNNLRAIELKRRDAIATAFREHCPIVLQLEQELEEINKQIEMLEGIVKSDRIKKMNRSASSKEKAAVLKQSRADRSAKYKAWKQAKIDAKANPNLIAAFDVVNKENGMARKEARANAGCYWCSYLSAEESLSDIGKGPPPKFMRWTGEGKVALQIQKPITVEQAYGEGSWLRIEKVEGTRDLYHANIRVGSNGQKPIFAQVTFNMHREFPFPSARITWVYLVCKKIATHEHWSVQFVLSSKQGFEQPHAETGTASINIGWRKKENGNMRAAYVVDAEGNETELILPASQLCRIPKCEDLQSIRDKHFDGIKLLIATAKQGGSSPDWVLSHFDWLKRQMSNAMSEKIWQNLHNEQEAFRLPFSSWPVREFPEWFTERTARVTTWKSQARLAGLLHFWRANRFEGDESLFNVCEAWRKRDKHLYEYQENNRKKFYDYRQDLYRKFARELRHRYKTLIIGKVNWKKMQDKPSVEKSDEMAWQRERKRYVAPSELELALEGAFGTDLIWKPCENITAKHQGCGQMSETLEPWNLLHKCSACEAEYDQDRNACLNLLEEVKINACVEA